MFFPMSFSCIKNVIHWLIIHYLSLILTKVFSYMRFFLCLIFFNHCHMVWHRGIDSSSPCQLHSDPKSRANPMQRCVITNAVAAAATSVSGSHYTVTVIRRLRCLRERMEFQFWHWQLRSTCCVPVVPRWPG